VFLYRGVSTEFGQVCRAGNLDAAKWLDATFALTAEKIKTDEFARHLFASVCSAGQLQIAKVWFFMQPGNRLMDGNSGWPSGSDTHRKKCTPTTIAHCEQASQTEAAAR
jgi:hypothetical protein